MQKVIIGSIILLVVIVVISALGALVVSVAVQPTGDVRISVDGGALWDSADVQAVDGESIGRIGVTDMAIAAHDPRIRYMGTARHALFQGFSGGTVWRQVLDAEGILTPTTPIASVAVGRGGHVYIGVVDGDRGRILRSDDGVSSVREVYTTPQSRVFVNTVVPSPHHSHIVWAGISNGIVVRSDDFGEQWQHMGEFRGGVRSISISPHNPSLLFIATDRRMVYVSRDGGSTWEEMTRALRDFRGATNAFAIEFDPRQPSVVYMASDFGLLRSSDAGVTWQSIRVPIPETSLPILDFSVDPHTSATLYAAAGDSLYQSRDGGISWSVRRLSTDRRVVSVILPLPGTDTILAGLIRP